jgi:hypothetical protein
MKKFIMPQNYKYMGYEIQHLLDMYLRKEKGLTNGRVHQSTSSINATNKERIN